MAFQSHGSGCVLLHPRDASSPRVLHRLAACKKEQTWMKQVEYPAWELLNFRIIHAGLFFLLELHRRQLIKRRGVVHIFIFIGVGAKPQWMG